MTLYKIRMLAWHLLKCPDKTTGMVATTTDGEILIESRKPGIWWWWFVPIFAHDRASYKKKRQRVASLIEAQTAAQYFHDERIRKFLKEAEGEISPADAPSREDLIEALEHAIKGMDQQMFRELHCRCLTIWEKAKGKSRV